METLENCICHLRLALGNWSNRLRLPWGRVLTRRILSRIPKAMNIRNYADEKIFMNEPRSCGRGRVQRLACGASDAAELHAVVLLVEATEFDKLFVVATFLDALFVEDDDLVGAEDC